MWVSPVTLTTAYYARYTLTASQDEAGETSRDIVVLGARGRRQRITDDSSVSQRLVLFPGLCHAEYGSAHRQTLLEQTGRSLVRHRQVRHQPGTTGI